MLASVKQKSSTKVAQKLYLFALDKIYFGRYTLTTETIGFLQAHLEKEHLMKKMIKLGAIWLMVLTLLLAVSAQAQTWRELLNRADSLSKVAAYDSAIVLTRLALKTAEDQFGQDDTAGARVLDQMGVYYYYKADYVEAESLWKRALAIRQEALGPEHPSIAPILDHLAGVWWELGKDTEVELFYKRALAIKEKSLGPDHPYVARTLGGLADYYRNRGKYAEAEPLHKRALTIRERSLGITHPEVARSLNNLSVLYWEQGKYAQAELLCKRALAICEKTLGPEHPNLGYPLSVLANIYLYQGRYTKAGVLLERVLAIREKKLGSEHLYVGHAANTLAAVRQRQSRYVEAESLYNRAAAIIEKALGRDHLYMAMALNNIAGLYLEQGKYPEAHPLCERALVISENALGPEHPQLGHSLMQLANLYLHQDKYSEAEPLLERSLRIREKGFGPEHPDVAECLESFSQHHRLLGNHTEGLEMAGTAFKIRQKNFSDNASVVSEKDALTYSRFMRNSANNYLSIFFDTELSEDTLLGQVANVIVASKGKVSDEIFARNKSLVTETDSATLALAEAYRYAKFRLAKLYVEGPGEDKPEHYRRMLDSLSKEKEELESELARRSASFKRKQALQDVSADRIAELIPDRSVLIEYLKYDRLPKKDEGVPSYLAVVLDSKDNVSVVDLGPADAIDSIVARYRTHFLKIAAEGASPEKSDMARYGEIALEFYKLVWKPIADKMDKVDLVFVAPDGALNMVSFAGLMGEDGKYLIEKYAIQYLSAGRDLLRLKYEDPLGSGLLAMGDPAFDASAQARLETTAPELVEAEKPEISLYAIRNVRSGCDYLHKLKVPPLPTTSEEIRVVCENWKSFSKEPAQSFVKVGASEENFKREASGKRVIHLATHGYYLTDECLPKTRRASFGSTDIVVGENPLLLSGLLLAGANLHGEGADSLGTEDGILTAEEISTMDLRGTQMVVLSACETGLGEVKSGEGVYGLRRAFQMAGARSVVVSLWPVSDRATAEMMSQLYSSRSENLPKLMQRIAKSQIAKLERTGQTTHPYSWGAFIAIGDWK